MNKLKYSIMRFMSGRYGPDKLYTAGFILFLIITVVNIFIGNPLVSSILSVLNVIIFITMMYRFFSKKIYKRKHEESVYLSFVHKITNPFKISVRKFKERKTHVYVKCSSCKAQLRLPRKNATLSVTCPKCKNIFKVKIK
ncbi:MAG: hypothetical protein IJZ90_04325 [Clostridia bacterium]|nr:hypothetical protein [Clostridia bacterium]